MGGSAVLRRSDLVQNCAPAGDFRLERPQYKYDRMDYVGLGGGVNNSAVKEPCRSVLVPRSPMTPVR